MNKSEQINLVAAALVKAQSEMGNAIKGSSNPFFKSKYSDLNAIREACLPALFANGLSVMQPTVVIEGKSYVETLVIHESGQFLGGHTEIVCSKQNDAQNFGAGTTYARRFGLQSLLCIGAEDDDGESSVGRGKAASNNKPAQATTKVTEAVQEATVDAPKKTGFGVKRATPDKDAQSSIGESANNDGWA